MNLAELHTLTGAFAVDALPGDEQHRFEAHLTECTACAAEVAELRATAGRLGLAVAETPPPALRDRVLRRIGEVRQEPPPSGSSPRADGRRPGRAAKWRTYALAACLAVAAVLGGTAVWQHQQVDEARRQTQQARQQTAQLAELLASPDARTISGGALPGGGSATAVVSQDRDRAALLASGMAEPPDGKVYQLWFADGDTMRPAGFAAPGTGAALLDGRVDGASGMGITVEPDGGSPQPTSDPVLLLEFTA